MKLSRREMSMLLPALAAIPAPGQVAKDDRKMMTAKAFPYEDLPVKVNGANKGRAVFDGETHLGFPIELHMTELGPGQAPHPPHQHTHEEVLMLRAGTLDATFGGKTTRLHAGSIIYMASNELHGWKNPGPDPAEYFVIALGKG